MKKTTIFSLRILFFGILLPFRIWQFSKNKLISKEGCDSITSLLDGDYIATSWFDWMIDAIIFLLYPISLFVVVIVTVGAIVTKGFPFFFLILALIPLYFMPLILSFARELGGSFMLLHLNVKKIRNLVEGNVAESNYPPMKKLLLILMIRRQTILLIALLTIPLISEPCIKL